MNVGIYLGGGLPAPQAGGGFTLPACLLNALNKIQTNHKFFIFFYGNKHEISSDFPSHVTYVPISRFYPATTDHYLKRAMLKVKRFVEKRVTITNYRSYLNRACKNYEIELMWFMTPSYERVEVPYLYTVWDLQHRHQSFFPEVSVTGSTFDDREKNYQQIIPKAAYVITGNNVAKQEVVSYYQLPDARVKTIEFPTPDFVFDKSFIKIDIAKKYHLSNPYLFYPAQFWPHKNHIIILKCLKILKNEGKKFNVIFTGSDKGNLEYIKEQVSVLGLQKEVFFLGFVSVEELVNLYIQAYALVFPSFFGPNNIPPLEAGALNCPVICADVDGMREQLGKAAMYFNPKNEHELTAKILELEGNDVRSKLIAAGFQRAISWRSIDYINQVIALVDEFAPIRRCWSSKVPYIHT